MSTPLGYLRLFNDLRTYFPDGIKKRILNFDQLGEVIREERFNTNSVMIYKYVREAKKLEEFNDNEKSIRTCFLNDHGTLVDINSKDPELGTIEIKFNSPSTDGAPAENTVSVLSKGSNSKYIFKRVKDDQYPNSVLKTKNETNGMQNCFIPHSGKVLHGAYFLHKKLIIIKKEQATSFDKIIEVLKSKREEIDKFTERFSESKWSLTN